MREQRLLVGLMALLLLFWSTMRFGVGVVEAARDADIANTKHNLSAGTDPSGVARNIKADSESQICVFCHTPHGASSGVTPLWNRKLGSGYTMYTSQSLDAAAISGAAGTAPGGSSKLCLSCHDGTLAIGAVNVIGGRGSAAAESGQNIVMTNNLGVKETTTDVASASKYKMPSDGTAGDVTGFTRRLGVDLRNDHPISISYNASTDVALFDGELRTPDGSLVGKRVQGAAVKPKLPLETTGPAGSNNEQMQCATCHDPHIRETDATKGNQKFLRLNRFQEKQPTGTFDATVNTGDIICLACHNKDNGGPSGGEVSWSYSAHANQQVANELYTDTAATRREFPTNLPVWKAACLNCHDTHTVQGATLLLREGTDDTNSPKRGGNKAQEEVCFQCHSASGGGTLQTYAQVPNIKTDFGLLRRMPITKTDQLAGAEVHEIKSNFLSDGIMTCSNGDKCAKDLVEPRTTLGLNNLNNRHAECTDCHNPHRVVKFKDFRGNPAGTLSGAPDASGTHPHVDDATITHSNIASGVLRGSWGVEPVYTSASFHNMPSNYLVKRGDPGTSTNSNVSAPYVTREYQICLKCHSDYAYADDNVYPNSTKRPQLGGSGRTPANSNGHANFTSYTNQAKEFQAPAGHAVAVGSTSLGQDGGAAAAYNANNHRSWHPVMAPTGRTGRAGAWRAPWNNSGTGGKAGRLGNQTMYCSDCHGSGVASGTYSVIPTGGEDGSPWGPHGSDNNFLLKGVWNTSTGAGQETTGLCFKCHSYSAYAGGGGGTGFQTSNRGDGHAYHANKIDTGIKCNFCHVAVPHGWKNRNLLVNLNDVGPEAGLTAGTAVWQSSMNNNGGGYSNGPYYRHAYLRVNSFPSGNWSVSNCNGGSVDGMKNNCETPN